MSNSTSKVKLAVFCSGLGTTFDYFCKHPQLEVLLLVTDNPVCGAIEQAKKYKIPYQIISKKNYSNHSIWDQAILNAVQKYPVDLIILSGYLSLVGPLLLSKYKNRILNSHPALLPKYGGKGMYGIHVHRAVLENNESKTGSTIHFVNEKYDEGLVLAQKEILISENDTPQTLQDKVKQVEKSLYADTIIKVWNQIQNNGST